VRTFMILNAERRELILGRSRLRVMTVIFLGRVDALDGLNVARRGEIVDDRVGEAACTPLFLERRAAD